MAGSREVAAFHEPLKSPVQVAENGTTSLSKMGEPVKVIHLEGNATFKDTQEDLSALPFCPDTPPDLVGALAGMEKEIKREDVIAKYKDGSDKYTPMEIGGKSRPLKCRSRQKLAIVIPYRNRFEHLHILLNNLIPILRRQQKDFQIFVIEQNMPTLFNRGMLFNVGYLEAMKFQKFDCFVFHDVDMLPLNDHALYTCKDNPVHLAAWTNKWAGGLPYLSYFGGVVMFSKGQFEKINGDSNLYFGWGGEDDDLWNRVKARGYTPIRYPQQIARYKMIKHKRDRGNESTNDRFDLLNSGKKRIDADGITSTVYKVTSIELHLLYTWVKVDIDKDTITKKWTKKGVLNKQE